ncbi:uracil-DNA glycosylase [Globicatella sulfidifaciens]
MSNCLDANNWHDFFTCYFNTPTGIQLKKEVDREYQTNQVFPQCDKIFHAFKLTPLNQVRVVILGQDPYHDEGQAQGLAFSVPDKMKLPPSLRNIFQELADDLGIESPVSGDLSHWATQGILLLNTSLTVRAHQANSHKNIGWQALTDLVIQRLNQQSQPIIFVLWGKPAQKKSALITNPQHYILEAPHPSPLSAYRGFFGSKPFSKINHILDTNPIQWVRQ